MRKSTRRLGDIIHQVENGFLLLIAIFTVVGMGKEIYLLADRRDVNLQDLLLMFLYVEVLGMVGAYYDSKQIPISLPIFIAITALARLVILQKEQPPMNLMFESGAILILSLASVVVSYRPGSKLGLGTSDRPAEAETEDTRLKL